MTQLAGIFGYPLAHSLSPAFQQAAFNHYGLDVRYLAWETPPEGLADEVAKLRSGDFIGANVTIPHKESVMALLDEVDPLAQSIGAVNTIVKTAGRLVGHNTDAQGFMRELKEDGGFEPAGKRVLLLGAGGAARAAAFALCREGVASITIANRNVSRAEALAEALHNDDASVLAAQLDNTTLGACRPRIRPHRQQHIGGNAARRLRRADAALRRDNTARSGSHGHDIQPAEHTIPSRRPRCRRDRARRHAHAHISRRGRLRDVDRPDSPYRRHVRGGECRAAEDGVGVKRYFSTASCSKSISLLLHGEGRRRYLVAVSVVGVCLSRRAS